MPKKEKGRSQSTRPIGKRNPSWCKYQPEEIEALVVKLAKEGNHPSRIGVILRDQYGVPLVRSISGKSIIDILKENGLEPERPEDLDSLLKKASRLHAHLERYKKDKNNTKSLQAVESHIRSLARYYKKKGIISEDWKYSPSSF